MGIKKILSLVIAAAMLTAGAVAVQADDTTIKGDPAIIPTDWNFGGGVVAGERYPGITEDGYTGKGLVFNNLGKASGYILAKSYIKEKAVNGNQYTLSFWYKGTGAGLQISQGNVWSSRYTVPADYRDGQWHFVEHTFTSNADMPTAIELICEGAQNCVIDDFSLKDSTGKELVINSDFEKVLVDNYASKSWTFSWTTAALADTIGHYARITDMDGHADSNHSLHIKYLNAAAGSTYFMYKNNVATSFEADQEYCLELYAKEAITTASRIRVGTIFGGDWMNSVDYGFDKMTKGTPDADGWTRYYKTFKATTTKSGQIAFLVEATNDLLIDDVAIYKTSDTSKTNLVNGGGFEDVFVNNIKAENLYKSTKSEYNFPNIPVGYEADYFAEISDNIAHGGTGYSLHMKYPHKAVSNRYVQVTQTLLEPCEAGEYTVTFYTYGPYSGLNLGIAWGEGYGGASAMTKEPQSDGWIKHTKTYKVDGNADNYMNIILSAIGDVYIDDFSIVKSGTTQNLVPDGGFESVEPNDYTTVSRVVAASAGSGAINLSWTNPLYSGIENIEVYVGDNLVSGSYKLTPAARNSVAITGLENYVSTPVEIVVTMNGKKYTTNVDVTADALNYKYTVGDWTLNRFPEINTSFNVDKNIKSEGQSSMRIDVNYQTKKDNYYPHIQQTVKGLDPASSYVLRFEAKADNIGDFKFIDSNPWNHTMLIQDYGRVKGEATHDWKEYTVIIPVKTDKVETETYDTILYLCAESGVGSLWIDNVRLYKGVQLPSGEIKDDPSVNYIKNGGFEFEDYAIAEPQFTKITGEEETAIDTLESGLIKTKVRIKNYTMGDGFKPALIVSLYNGTQLVDVSFVEQNVAQNVIDGFPSDELEVTVNVPEITEETDYNLKIMYWDGINTMKALDTADVFN